MHNQRQNWVICICAIVHDDVSAHGAYMYGVQLIKVTLKFVTWHYRPYL